MYVVCFVSVFDIFLNVVWMVFLQLVMLMFFLIFVMFSVVWLQLKLKSGIERVGVNVYVFVFVLNRFERLLFVVFVEVVSLIFGKNVVCVVLMLVLVVFSVCLVLMMLGWCVSRFDGMFLLMFVNVCLFFISEGFCGRLLGSGVLILVIRLLWFCVIVCVYEVRFDCVFVSEFLVWCMFCSDVLFIFIMFIVRLQVCWFVFMVFCVICNDVLLECSCRQLVVMVVIRLICVLVCVVFVVRYCFSVWCLRLCRWLKKLIFYDVRFMFVLFELYVFVELVMCLCVIELDVLMVGLMLVCVMWYCVLYCVMLSVVMCMLWLFVSVSLISFCSCGFLKKLCQLRLVFSGVVVVFCVVFGCGCDGMVDQVLLIGVVGFWYVGFSVQFVSMFVQIRVISVCFMCCFC